MKKTLNLLPVKTVERKPRGFLFYFGVGFIVYIIAIIGIWLKMDSQKRRLDSEISSLGIARNGYLKGLIDLKTEAPRVVSKDNEIAEFVNSSPRWDEVLATLSGVVPDDVWLGSLDISGAPGDFRVSLKGYSKSQAAVPDFMDSLEDSGLFADIELVSSQRGDKDTFFELKARLKWA